MRKIGFNYPFLTGKEVEYIEDAVKSGHISGNGLYTKKCHQFFKDRFQFKHCLLTSSCTDALEMAAILFNIEEGDEVIMPSYTFVSTANAFVLRGAKIVFCDSRNDHPCIDEDKIESLITKNTKAIVVVHYAGIACDMDKIMQIARVNNLYVVEDAAQAINSFYKGKPLGSLGHLATFSFHETKNIIAGEGGLLVVNDPQFIKRSEIIWEKGTNRSAFFRGEIDKYGWVDVGSSFLASELTAAFLYAQLENLEKIQNKRLELWNSYFLSLSDLVLKGIQMPVTPHYSAQNAHIFYLICNNGKERDNLISYIKNKGIQAVFHYLPLHKSPFYKSISQSEKDIPNSIRYADTLVRLPLYYDLSIEDISYISKCIHEFYAL